MTKMEEFKNMSAVELTKEVASKKHELLKLTIQTGSGQSKDTSKILKLRKTIARMQTAKNTITKSAN